MLVGVVLSAPEARDSGPYLEQWWTLMGIAALICLTGFALELVVSVIGGLMLTIGGVMALVAVGLGSPPRPAELTEPRAVERH